ncbi:MAG: ABC transporter substrate-binding protein [Bacteroidetes bacterium]|nr:MAG: ABC transporter substrate-binding protein [Bacteroidota bacterium]
MKFHSLLALSFLTTVLISCGGSEEQQQKEAIGGKMYGGEFKFMSSEKVESLFPMEKVDLYSQRINCQIYEPLLKIDIETMNVVPSIAESYSVSADAKTFTFKIRKGVKFHEDDCFPNGTREVTAEDVKFVLEMACSGLKFNQMSYLLVDRIEGAADFHNRSKTSLPKTGVSGIKVNGNEVEIKLKDAFVGFDKILTHTNLGIFPREAYEKYGKEIGTHPVGTGPFMLDEMSANGITLKRNPGYWRKDELGNQLPFLDKITMTYTKKKKDELLAFRNKGVDIVLEIPVEEIENVFGTLQEAQAGKNIKHKVESESSMNINYVAFACESDEFSNPLVRRAFNLAVNRDVIVDQYLLGEGWATKHGFVPKMDNFPYEDVKGFRTDADQARALLAKAGFPNGKGFPALDFYVNAIEGSSTHKMCQGVADQIKKELNIDLKIKLCTINERDDAINKGKAKIWRSGWVADYPDAENFLSLFYSGNIKENNMAVNSFRFRNAAYDALFRKAMMETDQEKRNKLMVKCDQMIIDEAAVMPIMTDDFIIMVNARVRDFKTNSMENLDFSSIFIKEPKNN